LISAISNGVAMAQQVADEAGILADPARAGAVRDPSRLHDRGIVAHVVHHAHEAVVEHRQRGEQHRLQRRHGGAAGGRLAVAGGLDLA